MTAKRSTSRSWVRAPPSAIPISKSSYVEAAVLLPSLGVSCSFWPAGAWRSTADRCCVAVGRACVESDHLEGWAFVLSCLVSCFFFAYMIREGRQPLIDGCHRRTDRHASSVVRIDQVDGQGMCCTDSGTLRPASVALDARTWEPQAAASSSGLKQRPQAAASSSGLKQRPQAAALEFSILQVGHGTSLSVRGIPESFSSGSSNVE
jgi:hypothetical protein